MRRSAVVRRVAARRAARRAAIAASVAASVALAAWGGFHLVTRLPFFRVERFEVAGIGYLTRDGVRAAAGVDSSASVWESTARIAARLESHPMVAEARVERVLPSTLLLRVREAVPVGLVASPLVEPVDRGGNVLPLDPTEPMLDLPLLRVVARRAAVSRGVRVLARDAGHLLEVAPEVFAVVSEARLHGGEATLVLGDEGLRVRYLPPISERRAREAVIALNDAEERFPQRVTREVDLRFAGLVVVRTEPAPTMSEAPAAGEGVDG